MATNTKVLGALFLLSISLVSSFDTGDHFETSRSALLKYNYSTDAISTIQVQNYYVDAYSQEGLGVTGLQKAHFDNLQSLTQVTSYWAHFTANVKAALEKAVGDKNEIHYLSIIGMSLHALQDFYTHSNFAYQHLRTGCGCLRTDTWFTRFGGALSTSTLSGLYDEIPCPAAGQDPKNFQGKTIHGDYCFGENKDSYIRPYYLEAVGHAYAATYEWLGILHGWADGVDPTFRGFVTSHVSPNPGDLADDLKFLLPVSELVNTPNEQVDGHWKGYESGDTSLFTEATADWLSSSSIYIDVFKNDKLHLDIYGNLYQYGGPNCAAAGPDPVTVVTPTQSANGHLVVEIRISTYDVSSGIFSDISPFITATVDGIQSRSSALDETDQATPDWSLLTFHEKTTGTIPISLEMRDRSRLNPFDSDPIAFFGSANVIDLTFDLGTKTVSGNGITSGTYSSASNALTISGDSATVKVWFATYTMGGCNVGTAASCSRQTPESIVSRDNYCQRTTRTISICVTKTTETTSNCKASLETAVAAAGFMEVHDVVTQSCSKACNVSGTNYQVLLYAPEDATMDTRISNIVDVLGSNALPGFEVLEFDSGSVFSVSLNLFLIVALFWRLF